MRLMKILATVAGLCLFAAAPRVAAVTVALQPTAQTINPGAHVFLDLVISGLGANSAPSLGAFTLELTYNPAILTAGAVTFGTGLDLGIAGSVQSVDLSTPGTVWLAEISLETAADLELNQPGEFTLATLDFLGLGVGVSPVTFSLVDLSDASGSTLPDVGSLPGSVTVTTVPESGSSALLLGIVLLAWGVGKKERRPTPSAVSPNRPAGPSADSE